MLETAVCRLDDLPDPGARGFVVDGGDGAQRVIVLREGDVVRVFENRCPHRGTPLDLRPDDFLDREGEHLVCATHGALFRKDDGHCIAGPCTGDRLEPFEARVEAGVVLVNLLGGLEPDPT
ncbi:MAG: Rieske (2Fe-2S) protein [Myxococcota bacterium]